MMTDAQKPSNVVPTALFLAGLAYCVWAIDLHRLEKYASQGNAEAQYILGKRYLAGRLLRRDDAAAVSWLHRAARMGHPAAQITLGELYFEGVAVPRDYTEAARWFRKAANHGAVIAQNQLGVMYANGKGVTADLREAMRWFAKATQQGSEVAWENLALAKEATVNFKGTMTTGNGKIYFGAKVQKIERDGLTISSVPVSGGFALSKINSRNLPADLQARYRGNALVAVDRTSPLSQLGSSSLPQ